MVNHCNWETYFKALQRTKSFNLYSSHAYLETGIILWISSVHFRHFRLLVTSRTAGCQTFLSITNSQGLLKLIYIESVMPLNHLIFCHPLLLLPSVFSSIRVFFSESLLHIRLPKFWSYSFSISLSNEYSGVISFRIDWFDILAAQGTLKSPLQHHNLKGKETQCINYSGSWYSFGKKDMFESYLTLSARVLSL